MSYSELRRRNVSTKFLFIACAAMLLAGCAGLTGTQVERPSVSVERLDCGTLAIADLAAFSRAGRYQGQRTELANSCYLIRHGETLMLWDTGLRNDWADGQWHTLHGMNVELDQTIERQLRNADLSIQDVDIVGVSHFHDDHTGQLAQFSGAQLLVGKGDWDWLVSRVKGVNSEPYEHWLSGKARVTSVSEDLDLFGDGSVVVLSLPGHTPGHLGLRVHTSGGWIMLTGDVAHFHENYDLEDGPRFDDLPAESIRSLRRFKDMARTIGARVVIQHDPADISLVPAIASKRGFQTNR